MATTKNRNRNRRNDRYVTWDQVATTVSRSAVGTLWRWRTEIVLLITGLIVFGGLVQLIDSHRPVSDRGDGTAAVAALVTIGVTVFCVLATPWMRRPIVDRAWCVISRHRLQRLFFEVTALHTRTGRVPLVLWIRPTVVGERAWIWCRAGICAEDFEAHTGEIRTACYARDARVVRNPKWSQLITVEIVRRDPLAANLTVVSPLARADEGESRGEVA